MSIQKFYNTIITTQRLADVAGSKQETYQANLSAFKCHIQPISGESQLLGGAGGYYQSFRMYCTSGTDILEGDKVLEGSNVYIVRGVLSRSFGKGSGSQHTEVLLSLGK